ncbi:MAG: hypothetical protein ACYC6C_02980 [Coriobacteriia bacterium]
MPWNDKRSITIEPAEDIVFDDAGSGLLEACTARFAQFGWSIRCDSHHAVWIKSPDAPLAVGLAPWMIDYASIDPMLDEVEGRIRDAEMNPVPAQS